MHRINLNRYRRDGGTEAINGGLPGGRKSWLMTEHFLAFVQVGQMPMVVGRGRQQGGAAGKQRA
jgi:hypothetical protein